MNTDQQRADFEAWYVERYGSERGTVLRPNLWPSGMYVADRAQDCWEAYQAGRAARQSQDQEDAERYRAMRSAMVDYDGKMPELLSAYALENFADASNPTSDELDAAIDHARRAGETQGGY